MLLYADSSAGDEAILGFEHIAARARQAAHGQLDTYAILAPSDNVAGPLLPTIHDRNGMFAKAYGTRGTWAYLIRPDCHVGHRRTPADVEPLVAHLRRLFHDHQESEVAVSR